MIRRIVIFLIRKKLGVPLNQRFRFTNQKSRLEEYFFTRDKLVKVIRPFENAMAYDVPSSVSLNWLLNDRCKIQLLSKGE